MRESPSHPTFDSLWSDHRRGLKAYLLAIVQDYHLAEDILQETSVVVAECWEKGEIRDFWAFAREVARRQALHAIRKSQSQPVLLSESALDALHVAFEGLGSDPEDSRVAALRNCMKKLPRRWMRILDLRYWREEKINSIALKLGIHANVVSVTINRAKSRLADCVSFSLAVRRGRT